MLFFKGPRGLGNRPPLSMFYVYIIKILDGKKLYIGYTSDLKIKMEEHLRKKSKYTKYRKPEKLVYYEAYVSKKDAVERERKLKKFKNSYSHLKKRIQESINKT